MPAEVATSPGAYGHDGSLKVLYQNCSKHSDLRWVWLESWVSADDAMISGPSPVQIYKMFDELMHWMRETFERDEIDDTEFNSLASLSIC